MKELKPISMFWAPVIAVPSGLPLAYILLQFLKSPATVGAGVVGAAAGVVANAGAGLINAGISAFSWASGKKGSSLEAPTVSETAKAAANGLDEVLDSMVPTQLKVAMVLLCIMVIMILNLYVITKLNVGRRAERRAIMAEPVGLLPPISSTRRRDRRDRVNTPPSSPRSVSSSASRSGSRQRAETFKFLGIRDDATRDDIEERIKDLERKWHPDRHTTEKEKWTVKFQRLQEAKRRLVGS